MSVAHIDDDLLSTCCDLFRTGHHAEASVSLEKWLQNWTAKAAANPELMDEASCKSLGVALDCQQRHDWIGLADELEYVLARQIGKGSDAVVGAGSR